MKDTTHVEDAADENKALREGSISCLSTCIFNVISLRLSEFLPSEIPVSKVLTSWKYT